jgi:serine/threonine protein kinase
LIREMTEALQVVHEADFIHRDVCPRNFICTKNGSSLKLIDFGLTVPVRKEFMQGGNRSGTPNYMAPEIIRRKPTDQRLDIFSLGVTAYQLCTYALPWPSQDVSGKAAVAHDNKAPIDIFQIQTRLNRTLGEAIMQCIRRNPAQRPPSAQAFLRMIRQVDSELD